MNNALYKLIVGLGNPGQQFLKTRHNVGFLVLDALAESFGVSWRSEEKMDIALLDYNGRSIYLVKPKTFMNHSGQVWPTFSKKGIKVDQLIIVHDELELPFGKIAIKIGGSAKGHNGLRSFISHTTDAFARVRFGIGRPEHREDVPHYVLEKFKESDPELAQAIENAVSVIKEIL